MEVGSYTVYQQTNRHVPSKVQHRHQSWRVFQTKGHSNIIDDHKDKQTNDQAVTFFFDRAVPISRWRGT